MRAVGEVVSPISSFGLGIMSCFMIARRIVVRTRAATADPTTQNAHDIHISGPETLFWFRDGTLHHQGTEVTLYLKPDVHLVHSLEKLDKRIHQVRQTPSRGESAPLQIDPVLVVARNVGWPLFPVVVTVPDGPRYRIDGLFGLDKIDPLNCDRIFRRAAQWKCDPKSIGELRWETFDWRDDEGEFATGSRIRLCFPTNLDRRGDTGLPIDPAGDVGLCRHDELLWFAEADNRPKPLFLVNGMFVEDTRVCDGILPLLPGRATRLWIDLRGPAAPPLTTSRTQALGPSEATGWSTCVHDVYARFAAALRKCLADRQPAARKNLLSGFEWLDDCPIPASECVENETFSLLDRCSAVWEPVDSPRRLWLAHRRYLRDFWEDQGDFAGAMSDESEVTRDFAFDLQAARQLAIERARPFDVRLAQGLRHRLETKARKLPDGEREKRLGEVDPLPTVLPKEALYVRPVEPAIDACLIASSLQAGFGDNMRRSWVLLGCNHLDGRLDGGRFLGPGLVQFRVNGNDHKVDAFNEVEEVEHIGRLVGFGYDIIFPFSSLSVGELRTCREWRTDGSLSQFGVIPFLIPDFGGFSRGRSDDFKLIQRELLRGEFKVEQIYAFIPWIELWNKPFAEWTKSDWNDTRSLSALWNLREDQVQWVRGAMNKSRIRKAGRSFDQLSVNTKRGK